MFLLEYFLLQWYCFGKLILSYRIQYSSVISFLWPRIFSNFTLSELRYTRNSGWAFLLKRSQPFISMVGVLVPEEAFLCCFLLYFRPNPWVVYWSAKRHRKQARREGSLWPSIRFCLECSWRQRCFCPPMNHNRRRVSPAACTPLGIKLSHRDHR